MNLKSCLGILSVAILLSACGVTVDGTPSEFDSIVTSSNSGSRANPACENLSGSYAITGAANLTVSQSGCESIRLVQDCFHVQCGMAGIPSFDISLALDGTKKEVGGKTYSATLSNGTLSVVTVGSRSTTYTYKRSSRPCDEAGRSGLEVKSIQAQGGGTVETCSAWY